MPDDILEHLEGSLQVAGHPGLSILLGAIAVVVVATLLNAALLYSLRGALRRRSFAHSVVRRAHRPLLAVLPLVGLMVYWDALPDAPAWVGAADKCTVLLLILAVTMTGITAARDLGTSYLRATEPDAERGDHRARRIHTQAQLLARITAFLVAVVGISAALMTFPGVRQIGASMLASAGVAGIVIGFAARPVLSNLLAGVQIALTQPIRLRDSVVVEGEWGWVEEIRATYVVIRIWDRRRLVLPLQWFIDHPFENWTRVNSNLIGVVSLWVDYRMPMQPLREEITRLCKASEYWDGDLAILQVIDSTEHAVRVRALVTAPDGPRTWELRCAVREGLIDFIQRDHPGYLPRLRTQWSADADDSPTVLPREAVEKAASSTTSTND
ncbi:MAG: mechanosensitive ion channel [Abyssibacter sp.]|nr:mechanosensitive ion channel domain-containing protein [Abyssibacter sp.]MCK5860219.1 mechanosensitive ion channel [Abyssibacter sp.]